MKIVKDGLHCYVVHSFSHTPYYLSTEYPMIRHNEIMSLLPVQVVEQNGDMIARYDITGKSSLADWGEKRKIGYKEFMFILQSLSDLFHDLEEYMLSMGQVCFQADQIFINSADQIHWMYLPEGKNDIFEDVNQLFLWILSLADYKEKAGLDLIYHVYNGIKRKEFGRDFVESCLNSKDKTNQSLPELPMLEHSFMTTDQQAGSSRHFSSTDQSKNRFNLKSKADKSKMDKSKADTKMKTKTERVATIITVIKGLAAGILLFFTLFLIICAVQFVMQEGMNTRMAAILVIAFLLFLLSAYGLLKILPVDRILSYDHKGENREKSKSIGTRDKDENVASGVLCCDTTGQYIPVLMDQDTGEEVELEIFPFYIGTKDGINHLCIDSQGLSRQHAVITRTEDGEQYRLEDLDSKTGTRVNGRQIDSACPVILQEGNRIEFGRSTWSFYLARS